MNDFTQGDFLEQFEKQSREGLKSHKCEPEEVQIKEMKRKKEENERLKKKSYEVEKLKEVRF